MFTVHTALPVSDDNLLFERISLDLVLKAIAEDRQGNTESNRGPYWIAQSDKVTHLVTGRTIRGLFQKQTWGGHKNDTAVNCGEQRFDATCYVLNSISLAQLHRLTDYSYESDDIGSFHVDWEGPFEVEIVQSILDYFGAEKLTDISQDALKAAWSNFQDNHPELDKQSEFNSTKPVDSAQLKGSPYATEPLEVRQGAVAKDEIIKRLLAWCENPSFGSVSVIEKETDFSLSLHSFTALGVQGLVDHLQTNDPELAYYEMIVVSCTLGNENTSNNANKGTELATYYPRPQILTVVPQ